MLYDIYVALISALGEFPIQCDEFIDKERDSSGYKRISRLFPEAIPIGAGEDDINKIETEGCVNNRYKGTESVLAILKMLLYDNLEHEYKYLRRLIEEALSYQICEAKGYFTKTDRFGRYRANLQNCSEIVKEKYNKEYALREKVIFSSLMELVDSNNKSEIKELCDSAALLTYLIANSAAQLKLKSSFRDSEEIEKKKKDLNSVVSSFVKKYGKNYGNSEYYAFLWKECSNPNIRDIQGINYSSAYEDKKIGDFYVIPHFSDDTDFSIKKEECGDNITLILAKSGAGKSSFLNMTICSFVYDRSTNADNNEFDSYKKFLDKYYDSRVYFPVLIRAKDFNNIFSRAKEMVSILDAMVGGNQIIKNEIYKYEDSNIVFLIDAIDEIFFDYREIFFSLLDELYQAKPNAKFVLTCRTIDLKPLFSKSKVLQKAGIKRLAEFDEIQIRELISHYHFNDGSIEYEKSIREKEKAILGNKFLRSIASNPYMLSIALYDMSINNNQKSVYDVYNAISENMIRRRWGGFGISFDEDEETMYVREILSYIAYNMTLMDKHTLSSKEFISFVTQAIDEIGIENSDRELAGNIVKTIKNSSGLITLEERGYSFQNMYLESFFSACWIGEMYLKNRKKIEGKEWNDFIHKYVPLEVESEYISNMIIMLFTELRRNWRNDSSLADELFCELLDMGVHSVELTIVESIVTIFIELLLQNFGTNTVTNKHSKNRKLAVRYITWNKGVECYKGIFNGNVLEEDIRELRESKLIN